MADFVENICNHGLETIAAWRNTYLLIWANACKYDGIDPDTKIVVFSEWNPIAPYLDRARRNWIEAEREFATLGYVGLRLDTRQIPKLKKTRKKPSRSLAETRHASRD